MFTGLVEEMGTISQLLHLDSTHTGGSGTSLTITSCPTILSDAALGDSISCNGTCLTITELLPARSSGTSSPTTTKTTTTHGPAAFKVSIAPETLRRTNLGRLAEGMKLNLERAARAETRMGGHYVQGHVDAVAKIIGVRDDGNAVVYRFSPVLSNDADADGQAGGQAGSLGDSSASASSDAATQSMMKYIVEKGYVSIDGASLTVTAEGKDWWEVMLIPYTRERIVMGSKGKGDLVNVEVDMVGKYVEKSVRAYFEQGGEGLPGLEGVVWRIVGENKQ